MQPWVSSPTKSKQSILTIADGLNQYVESIDIKDSECTSAMNVDSANYPALSTILYVRQIAQHFGIISKIFKYQDNLWITNGSGIYRQTGESFQTVYAQSNNDSTLWDSALFFDGTKMYFTDGVSQLKEVSGTTVTTLSDSPDYGSFVTTHSNRFFVAKTINNELRFSSLRDATKWTDTGITGSGLIAIETPDGEKPTGLTSFGDHVILFKRYSMHKLYGDDPDNFTMADPYAVGCVSDKTIVSTRESLFFLGVDGFYQYQGGFAPVKISDPIKKYIDIMNPIQQCCAGYDGRFIFLSLCTSGSLTPNVTLKYDTQGGRWWPVSFVCSSFYLDGTRLYAGTSDGRVLILNEGGNLFGAPAAWHIELKPHSEGDETIHKAINRLFLVTDMDPASTIKVSYAVGTEGTTWNQVYSKTNGTGQIESIRIPVIVRTPETWYRLRIEGTGRVKIHRLIKEITRRGS